MYKLIALDMDGTLLGRNHQISEENREWLKKATEAGIHICLSTGRAVQKVEPYVEDLGLKTPLVTVNGSEVWEKPGVLWLRNTVDPAWIQELVDLAVKYDAFYWSYTTERMVEMDEWVERPIPDYTWMKFGFFTNDEKARMTLFEILDASGRYELSNSHPNNIEVNPKGVSKASGLKEICRRLGFTMADVVAVGDSMNDIAMIREAGLGVAMGNAQPAVKAAADWITETNVNNGVAEVIRRVLDK
jgi:HAD superfamily hydrolase (TIGR01484 family)